VLTGGVGYGAFEGSGGGRLRKNGGGVQEKGGDDAERQKAGSVCKTDFSTCLGSDFLGHGWTRIGTDQTTINAA
jgi:hypothetical protein